MTVSYTKKVSDCKGFGSYWRLLFRWRGSLYKLVWPDTIVYIVLYFICSMVYRFGLNELQRRIFEQLSLYCDYFRNLIPISFVLGFYVSVVVERWWEQYLSIPWPDDFALLCTTYIRGPGERAKSIRATLIRYVNLTCVLTFSAISPGVKKKFPSYKEMLEAGYLTPQEQRALEIQAGRTSVTLCCLPLMWCCKLLEGSRTLGDLRDDMGLRLLVEEVCKLRDKAGMLIRWTDISIPLVYTQVVTMACYSFFFFSVLGRQFLDPAQHYNNRTIDFFVPIFTLLQFFFYMGWLKVAESLVNPFGEDDDDFELETILERHMKMTYLLGDVTPNEDPLATCDDLAWEKLCPGVLTVPATDTSFLSDLARVDQIRENGGSYHRTENVNRNDLKRNHDVHRGTSPSRDVTRPCTRADDQETLVIPNSNPKPDRLDLFWEERITPRGSINLVCPPTLPTSPATTPTNPTLPPFTATGVATEVSPEELSIPCVNQARDIRLRGAGEESRLEGVVNPTYLQVRCWFIGQRNFCTDETL
ncbi:hypothetical protein Pcinc_035993 [Petrolisthes cinctipes]|uniref:Bestrophin homolog n=1 Tax=Petrolisthes cinctipes TaxID=88211 RepID=A0AAE1EP21_PETCI|nr:hypothetical protein Pcinc_035993 [Petrolisthes cinctipes]